MRAQERDETAKQEREGQTPGRHQPHRKGGPPGQGVGRVARRDAETRRAADSQGREYGRLC